MSPFGSTAWAPSAIGAGHNEDSKPATNFLLASREPPRLFFVKKDDTSSHFSLVPSLFISEGKFSPDLPPVSLVDPMQAGVPPGAVDGRETARRARVRNPLHGAMAPGTFGRATGLGEELLCPGTSIEPRSPERASNEAKDKGDSPQ